MTHVLDLIDQLARAEAELRTRRFLSPCVPGVRLRVRIDGLVHEFAPNPPRYAGWGLFQPIDSKRAQLVERPDDALVRRYLEHLPPARFYAVRQAKGKAWWAMPLSAEGFRMRYGRNGPVVVHLCKNVASFETIRARWDGATFWFDDVDRFADPVLPEKLRVAFLERKEVDELSLHGVTPELVDAYVWATLWELEQQKKTLEGSIIHALKIGGGKLVTYRDTNTHVVVEWRDRLGRRHSSAIQKNALQVQSAGAVCLQGRDGDFDLASLVGVMDDAPQYLVDMLEE